jgi:hypothetical protein
MLIFFCQVQFVKPPHADAPGPADASAEGWECGICNHTLSEKRAEIGG